MSTLLDRIWREEAAAVLPLPTPLSYVDFARTIILPDGAEKGKAYSPGKHPAQLAILQALDGGTYFAPTAYREIAIAKPVQDGGSLVTLVPLMRRIICQRQTVLLAFPSLDSAKDIWTTKVLPILGAYGGQEPEGGGGSRGGAARVVTLPNGGRFLLRAAGGRGESQQASVTGDALCIDEADDWPDLHRIELITKRLEEAPDPLLMIVCTVKRSATEGKGSSLILAAVKEGTNSRLHYACPECGVYQPMEWVQVRYEADGQACVGGSARYVCSACGVAHQEDGWRAMFSRWLVVHRGQSVAGTRDDARVEGPIPATPRFGLRWTRLESPRKSLHTLCVSHARALWYRETTGDHGPMRSFIQDYLAAPYTDDQQSDDDGATIIPTRNRLAALSASSPYSLDVDRRDEDGDSIHLAHIPEWCEHTTVGVDVQRGGDRAPGRLIFACLSRGAGRGAITGWGSVIASPKGRQPTEPELHDALGRMDALLRDWAPAAAIVRRGVDVGDQQDEILRWLRSHRDWLAIKGTGPLKAIDRRDRAGWLYVRDQEGSWTLRLMETNAVTRIIHGELLAKDRDKPGCLLLPKGLERNSALVQHLCATVEYAPGKWSTTKRDSIHHHEWQMRHDYLDAAAMARALAYDWEQRNRNPPPARKYGVVGSAFGGI